MSTIIEVRAREILDSRGNPTVEADVTDVMHTAAVGAAAHLDVHLLGQLVLDVHGFDALLDGAA